jgi:hypothetical protein
LLRIDGDCKGAQALVEQRIHESQGDASLPQAEKIVDKNEYFLVILNEGIQMVYLVVIILL